MKLSRFMNIIRIDFIIMTEGRIFEQTCAAGNVQERNLSIGMELPHQHLRIELFHHEGFKSIFACCEGL